MRFTSRKPLCTLPCVLVLLGAMPLAASTIQIWALNAGSDGTDSIDVIDAATNKVVLKIDGIPKVHGVAFSPDGSRAYVTSESEERENALYVVDTKTGKILDQAPLSGRRGNVPAITKDGKRLLVCVGPGRDERGLVNYEGPAAGALDVVDTASLKVLKTLHMPGHDCYTTADGKYWIAGSNQNLVVIDVQTEEPLWKLFFKGRVATVGIESNPDGSPRRLFVVEIFNPIREFAVVDFAAHKEVTRVKLPDQPSGFKLQPPLTRRNPIPTHGSAVSPDGKILAVASRGSNAVFFYSLPEIKLLGYVPAPTVEGAQYPNNGSDNGWVTWTPDSKTLYVACAAANLVQAVDVNSLKEVARIPVGKQPDHVWTLVLPDKAGSASKRSSFMAAEVFMGE